MKTHLSKPIVRAAKVAPELTKFVLRSLAKFSPPQTPHWVFQQIAFDLEYRVPVDTRLGNGMKIRVVWTDPIGCEIRAHGYYEIPTTQIIQRYLGAGTVFFDVGSNVGQYSLLAAGVGAIVHGFEPDSSTFELLKHNVAVNRLTNVQLNRCALSDSCGNLTFYPARADNVGASSLRIGRDSCGSSILVEADTLDHYCERAGIKKVDFIKIDVEGAELAVLKGARGILNSASKPHLIVEFSDSNQAAFGSSCARLAGVLQNAGYRLMRICGSGLVEYAPREEEESFFNVLALPV